MTALQLKILRRGIAAQSGGGTQNRDDEDHRPLTGKAGRIYEEIERRLATGKYRFGEEISTTKLVEEFGASRAPVTTALNLLRAAGYLVITPQVGCRVVNPSAEEIRDFYLAYSKLEGVMAFLAAERYTPEQLELLRDIENRIREATPTVEGGDLTQFIELVTLFHELVRAMAHSPRMAHRVATFFWNMSEFFLWNGEKKSLHDKLKISNKERRAVVEAIANRDGEKAELLMEAHICGKPERTGAV